MQLSFDLKKNMLRNTVAIDQEALEPKDVRTENTRTHGHRNWLRELDSWADLGSGRDISFKLLVDCLTSIITITVRKNSPQRFNVG